MPPLRRGIAQGANLRHSIVGNPNGWNRREPAERPAACQRPNSGLKLPKVRIANPATSRSIRRRFESPVLIKEISVGRICAGAMLVLLNRTAYSAGSPVDNRGFRRHRNRPIDRYLALLPAGEHPGKL